MRQESDQIYITWLDLFIIRVTINLNNVGIFLILIRQTVGSWVKIYSIGISEMTYSGQ